MYVQNCGICWQLTDDNLTDCFRQSQSSLSCHQHIIVLSSLSWYSQPTVLSGNLRLGLIMPFPWLSIFLQTYDNGDSQLDSSELLRFIQHNESAVDMQAYADQESNKLLRSVSARFTVCMHACLFVFTRVLEGEQVAECRCVHKKEPEVVFSFAYLCFAALHYVNISFCRNFSTCAPMFGPTVCKYPYPYAVVLF